MKNSKSKKKQTPLEMYKSALRKAKRLQKNPEDCREYYRYLQRQSGISVGIKLNKFEFQCSTNIDKFCSCGLPKYFYEFTRYMPNVYTKALTAFSGVNKDNVNELYKKALPFFVEKDKYEISKSLTPEYCMLVAIIEQLSNGIELITSIDKHNNYIDPEYRDEVANEIKEMWRK